MKLLAQNYLTKLKDTLDLVPLKNINHLIKQIHKLKKIIKNFIFVEMVEVQPMLYI